MLLKIIINFKIIKIKIIIKIIYLKIIIIYLCQMIIKFLMNNNKLFN